MMSKLDFLTESLKNMKRIGTITQSSPYLARKMSSFIKKSDRVIVEYGAGDGAITRYILEQMHPEAILLSFEINETLHNNLSKIEDPRLFPICDGAQNLPRYLQEQGLSKADIIISGLPFLVLPEELMHDILATTKRTLREDGSFVQFHYATKLKKLYQSTFGNLESHFVLINTPPAFVYRCIKQSLHKAK